MKMTKSINIFLAVALALLISVAALPQDANAQTDKENKEKKQGLEADDGDDGEKLSPEEAKQARITMDAARAIALKRVSGSVKTIEEDLEKENGRLQYAFDIQTADGKIFDVEIDAITGDVLSAVTDDEDDDDDEKLSPGEGGQAKISLDDARAIALSRISGKVIDEELEKENGRLQYAFDIRDGNGKIWDVEVDAMTGAVLQADDDDADGDTEAKNKGQNGIIKTKNVFGRTARSVKNGVTKTVGKVF